MEQGEIVVERLTGTHIMLLDQVDGEWICRFSDGRQENRRTFELAPSPVVRAVELFARGAGGLSILFGQLQTWLVPSPRLLQLVRGPRRRATG